MKRFVAPLLALIFIIVLFIGCSADGNEGNVPSPSASPEDVGFSPSPSPGNTDVISTTSPDISDATPSPSPSAPDVSPSPVTPDVSPSPHTPDTSPSPSPGYTEPVSAIVGKPITKTATNSGAERTISALYNNLAAGMTWGDVWDDYVYEGSFSLGYTRSTFIAEKEDFQRSYGIVYKGISITSSEETKPGVFLIRGLLKYDINGELITETGSDYVVFKEGEYYISLSGSLLEAAFTKCVSSFPNISCLDAVVCEYADKTTIECTLYNLSELDYYIGAATGLPVTVRRGESSVTVNCPPGKIAAGEYYALTVEVPNYSGLPDKLTLEKIISLAETAGGESYQMNILLYYQ